MKKLVRTLSLMVCMALLMTAAPVDALVSAYASEVLEDIPTLETEVAEVTQSPAEGTGQETETKADEPVAASEPEELSAEAAAEGVADAPQESADAASETGEQPTDLPTTEPEQKDENSIDYTADAGKSPAFALGYAQILTEGAPLYADSVADAEIKAEMGKDGVVYVLGREDEPNRLKVTFNAGVEKGLDEGWMDAAALRPIEPVEEAAAYVRFCADEENVLYYNTLPLNAIVCSYVVAAEMTQAPEENTDEAQDNTQDKTDDGILSLEQLQIVLSSAPEEDADVEEDEDAAAPMQMSAAPMLMSAAPAALDATGIDCAAENLYLNVNDTYDLAASEFIRLTPEGATATLSYATENADIAAIDDKGLISAKKIGKATITVSVSEAIKASFTVNVCEAASVVTLTPEKVTMAVGASADLSVSFPENTYSAYTFESSDPTTLTVDAFGKLHALKTGSAMVTLKTDNGLSASCAVTVLPLTESVGFSETAIQLVAGATRDMSALLQLNPDGALNDLTYSTDKPEIIEVNSATGEIKALAVGTANVSVVSAANAAVTATCAVTVLAQAESIRFDPTALKIGVGNIIDLNTLLKAEPEGSYTGCTFKTSNKKYVAASAEGLIKGVKAGSATITAVSHNGKTATIKVQVYNAPKSITLSPATYTLGEEQEGSLKVSFPSKTYSLYSLSSDKPEVVSVDADGHLVAHAAGTATITAISLNGKKDSTVVTVLAAPDTISATHTQYTMGVGMKSTAVQGVYPANTMCAFEYASSDAGVVEVNAATGELTAKGEGVATITIKSKNSKRATASCTVTVLPAPESVSFSEATLKIGKGNIVDMNTLLKVNPENSCASYTFKTSNKKYVAANTEGLIKGVKAGSATITAVAHNGKTATIRVQVYNAPTKVTLTPAAQSLGVGMTSDLKVTFPSKTYSLYSFASSDESVATVNEAGRITALKPGTATITVTTANNRSAKCTVTVKGAPTFVEFLSDEYKLSEGMKLTLDPIIDANALTAFTFTSSNPGVASVDGNGVVTGHVAGNTTITVKTHNGITNQYPCTVTVSPAPRTLDYNDMPTVVIAKGDKVVIQEPIALDASGNECPATYTFKSSNSSYAKVNSNTVTGVKTGTVTITATSHNGKTASFKLKVVSEKITGLQLAYTDMVLYCNDDYLETRDLYAKPTGSTINHGSLSYVSSNPKVAFVTENGKVTGLTPGNTVLTVTAYNGVSATCKVEVRKLTTTLYFETPEATVTLGDGYITDPIVDFDSYGALTFASSDPSIAVVDENGHVTTLKSGDVTITATTPNHLSAETKLHIIPCPTGIRLNVAGMNLHVGDSFTLKAELEADAEEFNDSVLFIPENPDIAQVDAYGKVTALKPGSTRICVRTYNGITAYCTINVLEEGGTARAEFAWESATMVMGDTADLEFNLNKEAFERGFTLTSANPDVLSVDSANWTVTAKAAAPEGVKLTMTINAGEGELETMAEEISCTIYIIEKSAAAFSANELSLKTYNESNPQASRGELKLTGLPENLIGTYKLYVEDGALVTYDEKTGAVQALDVAGETSIVCKTYDRTISCKVTVEYLSTYRAVIVGEYINSSETGSNLPFGANNVSAVKTTLQNSYVDGQAYDQITYLPGNPTQAQIQSAISSTFGDAKEGDVSVVYIISHGYYGRADINNGGYFFGTPNWSVTKPDTIVTSNELMSWLAPIEGNVVLLLDSCRSGGFIRDQMSALAAEGNIAVLTAQTYDKTASYFIRASDKYSLEFLTYAFCYGLGYQYDQKIFLSSMAADSNGDNRVTVGEAFAYAKAETTSLVKAKALAYFKAGSTTGFLVPGVKTNAQLSAWGGQYPQSYIPAALNDVVIYAR